MFAVENIKYLRRTVKNFCLLYIFHIHKIFDGLDARSAENIISHSSIDSEETRIILILRTKRKLSEISGKVDGTWVYQQPGAES